MLTFDFDGVLHDSRKRAWHAYQTVRSEMGLAELPDLSSPEQLPLVYQGVLSQSLTRWIPYEEAERFWRRHARLTDATAREEERGIIPEIVDILGALAHGPGYSVVTGSHRTTVEHLLSRDLAVDAMPRVLLTRDDTGSKTDKLRYLAGRHGVTTYIGDTGSDIRHAKAAGLRAIAVAYGYANADDLTAAGPDLVLHTPADLAAWCRLVEAPQAGPGSPPHSAPAC
ncbi:hydrolase [Streptomyces laurentii]|uniref:Hydrolase n=1 Tax=Streptomyces laurentii TaxID=39478 RepID=A0A169PJH2_STRLU|nr:hydrolase [Streptomyces laurentii]